MMLVAIKAVFLAAAAVAIYLAVSAVAQLASRGPVCELPVVVEVLNGCGRAGIADKAASHLRACGFDVMYIGNAEDFNFAETLVVDRTGDRNKAQAVAAALGRIPVVYQMSSAFFVDVTVVLGSDASPSSWLVGDRANQL
jgi:hypothetical protein